MPSSGVTCVDKLRFETQEAAEGAKVYASHQHGTRPKVYMCKNCQLWHLASV